MSTDNNENPNDITTIRRIIFEHTEGLEARLRMAVINIRADREPLPKEVWTDLLQDIFKEYYLPKEQVLVAIGEDDETTEEELLKLNVSVQNRKLFMVQRSAHRNDLRRKIKQKLGLEPSEEG